MKTLHKYLVGQVFVTLALTVAVFTAVLLVGNALREILTLLATAHLSLMVLVKALVYLIPFVWVFALPMGMLTATLLVFGRFSADQELTAARASGISLLSLVTPVLLLSLLCCTLSAWFNMELGPSCRVAYLKLINELKTEMLSSAAFPEGRFIRDFPGYIFYVDKNRDGKLENVMIYKLENETNIVVTVRAPSGQVITNPNGKKPLLRLNDPWLYRVSNTGAPNAGHFSQYDIDLNDLDSASKKGDKPWKPGVNDMTFLQLRQELHELESLNFQASYGTNTSAQLKEQLAVIRKQQKDFIEPVRVAMHRQIALSFACFGFTLIGIPLGIRVHRRETNIGIAIALILVVVYFAFINLGASLSGRPEFFPHFILWIPNFLFQAVGVVLLWRANKGI